MGSGRPETAVGIGTGKQVKMRYQMRGLGIGIVVTALLMGVATKDKLPLTDAEIKAKAYELGMVESDSLRLTDIKGGTPNPHAPKGTVPPQETKAPEETGAPEKIAEPKETGAPEGTLLETMLPEEPEFPEKTAAPTIKPTAVPTIEPAAAPTIEPTTAPGQAVAIVINRGADSYSVSRQLAEAGLVSDMGEFDRYLCNNGYAGRICVGTFWITPGSSEEQIAKIVTRTD